MIKSVLILIFLTCLLRTITCQSESGMDMSLVSSKDLMNFLKHIASLDPDKLRGTGEFITSRGFDYDLYQPMTPDGYAINVIRIKHPHKKPDKQAIMCTSVSGGSSVEWLRNSPGGNVNESLKFIGPNIGFELAKRGWDVWLSDWRGAKDTTKEKYDRVLQYKEYYEYSFDEYALFDLATAFDTVRQVIGVDKKVGYLGLIDSTTAYFMLAATVPRFNHQIQPVIALSPGWSQFAEYNPSKKEIEETKKQDHELVKQGGQGSEPFFLFEPLSRILCNLRGSQDFLCNPLLYYFTKRAFPGGQIGSLNYPRLTVYAATAFKTTRGSNWIVAQSGEFSISERITMLNVSSERNVKRYGFKDPPEYLPERITNTEMHFINAESSKGFTIAGIAGFKKQLGTKIRSEYNIPAFVKWSPMSFQDGRPDDVAHYVNRQIINILDQYVGKNQI